MSVATSPAVAQVAAADTSAQTDSPYYHAGQSDRADWDKWIGEQTGEFRDGAIYWSGQRSLAKPGSCDAGDQSAFWQTGCMQARIRLALPDALRVSLTT